MSIYIFNHIEKSQEVESSNCWFKQGYNILKVCIDVNRGPSGMEHRTETIIQYIPFLI